MNDQTLCRDCEENGVITLATEELELLGDRYPACQKHYDRANDRWLEQRECCARAAADKQRGR